MRVVLVGSYSLETGHIHGGVQAATAYLVKGLARIDNLELHILTMRPVTWDGSDSIFQHGAQIHLLPPYPRFERLRGYRVYQSMLDNVLSQIHPTIVHAQEAGSGAYIALRSHFPTVVTVHGIRAEDAKYIRSWRSRLRFYFDSILTERPVIRRTKYLIAISRYVTAYFAPLLQPNIHMEYIPNAVDESFFNLGSDYSQKPVVLYAGRVIPRKRVLDLVQAFKQVASFIPQVELRIAGETTSDSLYVKSVKSAIQQAGLNEHVHLLGELQENDLLNEYRNCTLVALPSSQETTPMVLAQAMAAGKPVIATPVGGVAEMVGMGRERGLIINVGDVDTLASSIVDLLQNPARCVLIGRAGHTFALENYHLQRVAQRTYEFYCHISSLKRFPNE